MNGKIIIAVISSVVITMMLMNKKDKANKESETPVLISSPFYNPYPYYGHPSYYYPRHRRHRYIRRHH